MKIATFAVRFKRISERLLSTGNMTRCSDGTRPVIFKIERIDEEE